MYIFLKICLNINNRPSNVGAPLVLQALVAPLLATGLLLPLIVFQALLTPDTHPLLGSTLTSPHTAPMG